MDYFVKTVFASFVVLDFLAWCCFLIYWAVEFQQDQRETITLSLKPWYISMALHFQPCTTIGALGASARPLATQGWSGGPAFATQRPPSALTLARSGPAKRPSNVQRSFSTATSLLTGGGPRGRLGPSAPLCAVRVIMSRPGRELVPALRRQTGVKTALGRGEGQGPARRRRAQVKINMLKKTHCMCNGSTFS